MPTGLKRFHQTGDLHHITFSCVRKRPILGTPEARDTFVAILEQTREKYRFHVLGYVVMSTHVHMLVTEPEIGLISTVMQVIKQRFSRTRTEEYVWETRYYDLNVRSDEKRREKLVYIHRNPVRDGLVEQPEDWKWSSYRAYASGDLNLGPVTISRSWQ
jgi:putative transposase